MSGPIPEVESPGLTTHREREAAASALEQTYKARDVEGWLDIHFYRPIGFQFARFFARLHFTPAAVSSLGGVIGAIAGHFYFYPDLRLNLLGFALQALANVFDNADGQLARLTNQGTVLGAFIDGCADYLVFMSVYLHLAARFLAEGSSQTIWFLIIAAAASHAVQSLVADYYRAGFLRFVEGKPRPPRADELPRTAVSLGKRLLQIGHHNYVQTQERLLPAMHQLIARFPAAVPAWLTREYRVLCRPLLSWERLLSTNTRMLVLLVCLLLMRPRWYLWSEIVLLNVVLVFVITRHQRINRELLARATE